MADQEAWMELCDLYISQQEWNKAAFCVEELMLHSPFNHLYLQRYAEIKYTQVIILFTVHFWIKTENKKIILTLREDTKISK